jgi:hypothetical protein
VVPCDSGAPRLGRYPSPGGSPRREPASGPESPEDDAKRKFREALDRKRSKQADLNARQSARDGGKVQGAHGPAQSKRAFRRKSGG